MTKSILLISLLVLAWIMTAQAGTTQVAPGLHHTCAVTTEGQLLCWGGDEDGQLGDGTAGGAFSPAPQPVTGVTEPVDAVATNNRTNCYLANSGNLYCWGQNDFGEAGIGAFSDHVAVPTRVTAFADPLRALGMGGAHGCAVDFFGVHACWGYNNAGQLGDGPLNVNQPAPIPIPMPSGVRFVKFALASTHSCAIDLFGKAYCWGNRGDGRLGDGMAGGSRTTPARVLRPDGAELPTVSDLAASQFHACALSPDGSVSCWGNNSWGQQAEDPVQVPSRRFATPIAAFGIDNRQVALGQDATCLLKRDGSVWCVGDDTYGQLGDGTLGAPDQRIVPQPVTGLPGPASAIQMGIRHGCAIIAADQSLWCWGQDFHGQLGDGTVGQPERQPYAGQVVGISVRSDLLSDGFEGP